jgi:hypothetical protein
VQDGNVIAMRLVALVLAGCAVSVPAPATTHPANPAAPTGRLAGAPATLRPGVVDYALPAAKPAEPEHVHHHHAP